MANPKKYNKKKPSGLPSKKKFKKSTSSRKLHKNHKSQTPEVMLSKALSNHHNNASLNQSTKDMELEITQYITFDTSSVDGPVLTYGFNTAESFLFQGGGASGVNSKAIRNRVKNVRVQAWPRPYVSLNDDPLATNIMYGVLAQVPSKTSSSSSTGVNYVHTSSTQIMPTVDPDWYNVLEYDAEKLFSDSQIQPLSLAETQTLFSIAAVNLTTGAITNTLVFDLQVTFTVMSPIPVQSGANVLTQQVASFAVPPTGTSGGAFNLVDIKGMRDHYLR